MSSAQGPILVVGIGNVLLRDEGAGVHVVRALRDLADSGEIELPRSTTLLDGGTLGLGLLQFISDARAVLLIDAMDGGREPGSVEVFRGDTTRDAKAGRTFSNSVGVGDLLATARLMGDLPDAVALVGIQPSEISVGLELTEIVRAALPTAVAATLSELRWLDAIAPVSGPGPLACAGDLKGAVS
jgi:hydrogenase maturation protease